MENRLSSAMLGSEGSSNVSFSGNETDEYPDPARYNLSDRQDQLLFMQRYHIAQRHDPQMKYAVLFFYVTIVSGRSSAAADILITIHALEGMKASHTIST